MLSGPSFRSAFVFCINSLIWSCFLLASFHLAETYLPSFSWLYTVVCAVVQKYFKKCFVYNYSRFWHSFCNKPVLWQINLFYCTTWKRKQTMEQQLHRTSERTKSKQKQNQITSHSKSKEDEQLFRDMWLFCFMFKINIVGQQVIYSVNVNIQS